VAIAGRPLLQANPATAGQALLERQWLVSSRNPNPTTKRKHDLSEGTCTLSNKAELHDILSLW